MRLLKDLGQLKPTENSDRTYRYGLYLCPSCKDKYKIQTRYIKKHKDICKICSARERKNNLKHGGGGTRLYGIWKGMRDRCNNPNSKIYKYYGGKGVKVCSEWDDFSIFKEWSLENGYDDLMVLDKDELSHDNNIQKKYSPNNCQWVTTQRNYEITHKENK